MLVLSVLAGACRFVWDNPAERLIPGEIRGRVVRDRDGSPGEKEPVENVRVRLRGSPMALATRATGFFALVDLPVGDHVVTFEATGSTPADRRSVDRLVTIGVSPEGQPEGVVLGDVTLFHGTQVGGRVTGPTGAPLAGIVVVDEVSLAVAETDETGGFTFPVLTAGRHVFRAAGTVELDGYRRSVVGGTIEIELTARDERNVRELGAPLALRPAEGSGVVALKVDVVGPSGSHFPKTEARVEAIPSGAGRAIPLPPPDADGRVEAELPEGSYAIVVYPPSSHAGEFDLPVSISDVVVLGSRPMELGTMLLVSSESIRRSRLVCGEGPDCTSGLCKADRCEASDDTSEECSQAVCSENAFCTANPGSHTCACNEGFTGDGFTCAECPGGFENPCSGNGACIQTVAGRAVCSCEPGWTGDACDTCEDGRFGPECAGICPGGIEDVCNGRGACAEGPDGDGTCTCDPRFTGEACERCAHGYFGPECDEPPTTPGSVVASQGVHPGFVRLSWSPAANATRYRVLRDGVSIAEVEGTSYDDEGASPPDRPGAPVNLQADGHTDLVELSWEPAVTTPGVAHRYSVIALNGEGESAPATEISGYAGALPVEAYEVSWDGGDTWVSAGLALRYQDRDAPAGRIVTGAIEASQGMSPLHVELRVSEVDAEPGAARSYLVRAVDAAGSGTPSTPVPAKRQVGAVELRWERSANDSDAAWAPLPNGTSAIFLDEEAPLDGAGRWYRVVISAEGAQTVTTTPVRGFRALLPIVRTVSALVDPLLPLHLSLQGQLDVVGVPPAIDHGFCFGTAPSPDRATGTCVSLGTPAVGDFAHGLTDLLPSTLFHVRAWAEHPHLGTVYGEEHSAKTLLEAPKRVMATLGEAWEHVRVTWEAVTGAVAYRILRDEVPIAVVDSGTLMFEDPEALAGALPEAPLLTVFSDDHDAVPLEWLEPEPGAAGQSHDYRVVALDADDVEGAPGSSVQGHRGPFPITGYEVRVDDGEWTSVGSQSSWLHTEALPGTITSGVLDATPGTALDAITVTLTGASVNPAPLHRYELRAITPGGAGAASTQESGRRAVGEWETFWERAADVDADWNELSGSASLLVDTPPLSGVDYWYRARLSADGTTPVTTAPVSGFLALLPQVLTGTAVPLATTAKLTGTITSLSRPEVTSHGFCWGTGPEPALDHPDSTCVDLGPHVGIGVFQHDASGLAGGTTYRFRAFAALDGLPPAYGSATSFLTLPLGPASVQASQGEHEAFVRLTWPVVVGALEYRVHRDGAFIGKTALLSFDDTGASASKPDAPPQLEAVGFADRIDLSWQPATVSPGGSHEYWVTAVNLTGESDPGSPDDGWRKASPVTAYELSFDGDESWQSVGATTSWSDFSAPSPVITSTTVTASQGAHAAFVAAQLDSYSTRDGILRSYRVRARNAVGASPTTTASARRLIGPVSLQWERSLGTTDSDYVELPGATSLSAQDGTAPPDGEKRWYRVRFDSPGLAHVYSDAAWGFRGSDAEVTTLTAMDVTSSAFVLRGQVDDMGNPEAHDHGFCVSELLEPLQDPTACVSLGAPAGTGSFQHLHEDLPAGTRFSFRAWIENLPGRYYGDIVEVTTAPEAPGGVVASQGDHADRVSITWEPSAGADAYEILRDGIVLGTVPSSDTEFIDWNPPAAPEPGAPRSLSASAGTFTDRVRLTWTAPDRQSGAPAAYTIRARKGDSTSDESETAAGWVGPLPILGYDIFTPSQGRFVDVGNTTSANDYDAPPPQILGGTAFASQGESLLHVELALQGATATAGTWQTYRVRAYTSAGPLSDAQASGHRGTGALQYQWESASLAQPSNYTTLPGATSRSWRDTTASPAGETRHYRCRISIAGVGTVVSASAIGHRQAMPASDAQQLPWFPDGVVHVMASTPDHLFLGGTFDRVRQALGPLARIGPGDTEAIALSSEKLDGVVRSIATDSKGALYVGGDFTVPGRQSAVNLVRIDATGVIDPSFSPHPDGAIHAVLLTSDTLYVAGDFDNVGGRKRRGFAALDLDGGSAFDGFVADVDGVGRALLLSSDDGNLFVGGDFNTLNGKDAAPLARVDPFSGTRDEWDSGLDGPVEVLSERNGRLYVGGSFTHVGTIERRGLAAFLLSEKSPPSLDTGFAPPVDGTVHALEHEGEFLYAGGNFVASDKSNDANLLQLSPTNGTRTPFSAGIDGPVHTLLHENGTLHVGGAFKQAGRAPRANVAAFGDGQLIPWDPGASDTVFELRSAGKTGDGTLLVGGAFLGVAGPRHRHLVALHREGGGLVNFDAEIVGTAVRALAIRGDHLFVGGTFTASGGFPHRGLALFDLPTWRGVSWDARLNGQVASLHVHDDRLYVGGSFSSILDESRDNAAAIQLGKEGPGSLEKWAPDPDGTVLAITTTTESVVLGGAFGNAGGESVSNLVGVDHESGEVNLLPPAPDGPVVALDVGRKDEKSAHVLIGGDFETLGSHTGKLAAFDPELRDVRWTAPSSTAVRALASHLDVVFAAGTFPLKEGSSALTGIESATGTPVWGTPASGTVSAIHRAGDDLYVAGPQARFGAARHLAVFSPAHGQDK